MLFFQAENLGRALQDQARLGAKSGRESIAWQCTLKDQAHISVQLLPERIQCKQNIKIYI